MDIMEWLEPRGGSLFLDATTTTTSSSSSSSFGDSQLDANSTSTAMLINTLRFAAAKSIRTSTIILACFNVLAAFGTAAVILYECYATTRRNDPKFRFRRSGFSFVNTAEVFPLVLSLGITVQGIIFAVAQSTGLENLLTKGCTLVAELMLPAVFLVAYIQLVFGLETTFRGLRTRPFAPRGKWAVPVCLGAVGLLLLATFLVAFFIKTPDFCFASLFWFVARYSIGCFGAFLGITVFLAKYAILIYIRLRRSTRIEASERVAASRLIYYMAFGVLSNGLLIPFFYSVAFYNIADPSYAPFTLSMMSAVVVNVSGLMTGGLHLFLRSGKFSVVQPKDKVGEYERQKLKYQIRVQGPGDFDFDDTVMGSESSSYQLRRMNSDASLVNSEKEEEAMQERSPIKTVLPSYSPERVNPLRANAVYAITPIPRTPPQPIQTNSTQTTQHIRKRSYSLFPGSDRDATKSVTLLPATTYSPNSNTRYQLSKTFTDEDTLKPPPSIRGTAVGHKRDSSMASLATVQMVLRLSSAEGMPPIDTKMLDDIKVHNLDCPKEIVRQNGGRPSPLGAGESASGPDTSPTRAKLSKPNPSNTATMKNLPPVPKPGTTTKGSTSQSGSGSEAETLSPTVYSPQSPERNKLPSPRGVGFTRPAVVRSPSSAGVVRSPSSTGGNSSARSPPPRRPTLDGSSPRPVPGKGGKADWI